MNTQNVNVKTATKESTERWVENRLSNAISEQKILLMYLAELKNRRMLACEKEELVWGTLMRMAENVLSPGGLTGAQKLCGFTSVWHNRGFRPVLWLKGFLVIPVKRPGSVHERLNGC